MNVIYKSSKTQFTEEIERIFENELDYIKHSECPIEESYERICIIYQNVFQKQINYSDKILIMALLNELNNEIPK
jgi:hypothetical protein